MRIETLRLLAFGPFTDVELDFSSGEHGLHLVFGPNEAGKSSALRGLTDLLFEVPLRSGDNFRHPYQKLRLGGRLRLQDGTTLDFVRRKGRQSLRTADDRDPLASDALQPFLAGVDKDLFLAMFALNHERLVSGGRDILQQDGRLGELLFEAGTGFSSLQTLQQRLQTRSDELFKRSGKKPVINRLLREWGTARERVRQSQLVADDYHAAVRLLEEQRRRQSELDELIREAETRLARWNRWQSALPLLARRRSLLDDLGGVLTPPPLSQAAVEEIEKLLQQQGQLQTRCESLQERMESLDRDFAAAETDPKWIAETNRLDQLRTQHLRYRDDQAQRPACLAALQRDEHRLQELLHQVGRDPQAAWHEIEDVPKPQATRVQELGGEYKLLSDRWRRCEQDQQRLQNEQDANQVRREAIQAAPAGIRLDEQERRWQRAESLLAELARVSATLAEYEQQLEELAPELGGWDDRLEELQAKKLPADEQIGATADRLQAAEQALVELRREREKTELQLREQTAQLDYLEHELAVPTHEQLRGLREMRDQLFEELSTQLSDPSPEEKHAGETLQRLQQTVREADDVADRLRSEADRVAQQHQLAQQQAVSTARLAQQQQQLDERLQEQQAAEKAWRDMWSDFSDAPGTPAMMARLKQAWADAVKLKRKQQQTADEWTQLNGERERLLAAARELLEAAGLELDDAEIASDAWLPAVREQVERWRNSAMDAAQVEREAERLERELQQAKHERAAASTALDEWRQQWAAEMERLQLTHETLPAEANSVLGLLNDIAQLRRDAQDQQQQLDRIDEEAVGFQKQLGELCSRLEIPTDENDSAEALDRRATEIITRLEQTVRDEETATRLQQQREQLAEQLEALTLEQRTSAHRLEQLTQPLGEVAPDQLAARLEQVRQRRERLERLEELDTQLAGLSAGESVERFLEEVEREAADADRLASQITATTEQVQLHRQERDACLVQIDRQTRELNEMSGTGTAAQCAEEAEQLASELGGHVRELAVTRLMEAALRSAIQRYREAHQNPLLEGASRFFSQLTCGGFRELLIDLGEDGEPLVQARRRDGDEAITVEQMSDGTRDQLFLAFRLASLQQRLTEHEPLPLILDDVLMNFDDQRALAGLETFLDFAQQTQVILFTHHQHLVELATTHLADRDLHIQQLPTSAQQPLAAK